MEFQPHRCRHNTHSVFCIFGRYHIINYFQFQLFASKVLNMHTSETIPLGAQRSLNRISSHDLKLLNYFIQFGTHLAATFICPQTINIQITYSRLFLKQSTQLINPYSHTTLLTSEVWNCWVDNILYHSYAMNLVSTSLAIIY